MLNHMTCFVPGAEVEGKTTKALLVCVWPVLYHQGFMVAASQLCWILAK